jgi:hypothetical protein
MMRTLIITAGKFPCKQNKLFDRVALRRFERGRALAAMYSVERIADSMIILSLMVRHVCAVLLAASSAVAEISMQLAERVAGALIAWVDVTLQRHGKHG